MVAESGRASLHAILGFKCATDACSRQINAFDLFHARSLLSRTGFAQAPSSADNSRAAFSAEVAEALLEADDM